MINKIRKKKYKVGTDLEQSRKLMELGVDPDTADMFWDRLGKKWECHLDNHHMVEDIIRENNDDYVPAWSLSALLSLIPKINEHHCMFGKRGGEYTWQAYYFNMPFGTKEADDPVDAAYTLLVDLLENKML